MAKLNVKAGDKVIACNRNGKYIAEVSKVTPTGRIRIAGCSSQFSPEGDELGSGGGWYEMSLYPYSEEEANKIIEENTKKKAVLRMMRTKYELWEQISIEDARKISGILIKYERKGDK